MGEQKLCIDLHRGRRASIHPVARSFMVVPVLSEAQPHRFVGTVCREIVESSGTSELLFGNIDRFDSYVPCLGQSSKGEKDCWMQKEIAIEKITYNRKL